MHFERTFIFGIGLLINVIQRNHVQPTRLKANCTLFPIFRIPPISYLLPFPLSQGFFVLVWQSLVTPTASPFASAAFSHPLQWKAYRVVNGDCIPVHSSLTRWWAFRSSGLIRDNDQDHEFRLIQSVVYAGYFWFLSESRILAIR